MTDLDGGIDLDEPSHYSRVDHSDALADVEGGPWQWDDARRVALNVDLTLAEQVCVVGMGGSGIAGHILSALVADRLEVPLFVHQGYGLPRFVGPSTQVIALSHSGNTEETLDAVAQATARGAPVAAVTSGGRLGALAERNDWPVAIVPAVAPPRHSLGWLLVPLLGLFSLGDQLDEAIAAQRRAVAACGRHIPRRDNPAKLLAEQLAQVDLAVAWGTQGAGVVAARRLAAQLNENAKLPAYAAALPEADHNAIVGHWLDQRAPRSALLMVRDPAGEHERVAKRVAPTLDVVDRHFAWTDEVVSTATAPLARMAELVMHVDLISVYTALARGEDPTPIAAIDRLKAVLA
ncbi:MAG: bifunctional phosphoglucose/phosphomannose isomerase [Actinobacteria bacterium]|nr:bifunctional phosphoglucose/phosphomannose isomerase [Actinomycetota bacterium]